MFCRSIGLLLFVSVAAATASDNTHSDSIKGSDPEFTGYRLNADNTKLSTVEPGGPLLGAERKELRATAPPAVVTAGPAVATLQVAASQGWARAVHDAPTEAGDSPAGASTPDTADSGSSPARQLRRARRRSSGPSCAPPPPGVRPNDSPAVSRLRSLSGEEKASRLLTAAQRGAVDELWTLVEAGADVGATNEDGTTALHWAAYVGHVAAVRCLLQAGAAVDARDRWRGTPLHLAAVRVLARFKADLNARHEWGWTPLHFAAKYGHAEVARALLEAGANVWAQDDKGETPLDFARMNDRQELTELLT